MRAAMTGCLLCCRHYVREVHETDASQVELFLNSVPILAPLTRDEKLLLLDALEEQVYGPGVRVINQVGSWMWPLLGPHGTSRVQWVVRPILQALSSAASGASLCAAGVPLIKLMDCLISLTLCSRVLAGGRGTPWHI